MIKLRFLFLIIVMPLPTLAEVVTIRGGEHENFTRLVLSIQEGTDWAIDQMDGGFRLTLGGHADGFDLSEAFERIPRDRLANLNQTGSDTLDLELSCECSVEPFLWRSDRLVLDISAAPIIESTQDQLPIRIFLDETAPAVTGNLMGLPDISNLTNGLSLTRFTADQTQMETTPDASRDPSEDTSLSEASLVEGIARAASQGFLIPNVQNISVEPEMNAPEHESLPVQISIDPPENYHEQHLPGVDITTALDQNLAELRDILEGSIEPQCLSSDLFAISDWGDDSGFHQQVAALSEMLAGEFGEDTVDAETDLARLYIHFGFGAEALVALSISQAASQSRQILFELAALLDETESEFPLLKSQRGCETAGALWAFLAHPDKPETDTQTNIIARAFFELPQPLRGYIAPKLSQAFLSIEMPTHADSVLRATDNRDAEDDPNVQTTRAYIAEQNNDPEEAISLLSEQANDTARLSPEAAIRLVTLTLEQGGIPQETDLVLLSAMAVEFDTLVISDEIESTEALGWSARGEYFRALDLIAERSDLQANQTRETIYLELIEKGLSNVFLEFAINDRPNELTANIENATARRLIDLGFADHALDIISGPARRSDAAERRYLKAEASLEIEDYSSVIVSLEGLNNERARNLRSAAYSGLGDFRNAIATLGQDQAASTPDLQFRAEAWERLSLENDPVLSDFARAATVESDPGAANSLAERRSLLEQSQDSRRAVESLLLRFDGTVSQRDDS